MRRTFAWPAALALTLGAAVAGAQESPRPQQLPPAQEPSPKPPPKEEPGPPKEGASKEGASKKEPPAGPRPVLFPQNPFPPPAPPLVDPRTGAWQQLRIAPGDQAIRTASAQTGCVLLGKCRRPSLCSLVQWLCRSHRSCPPGAPVAAGGLPVGVPEPAPPAVAEPSPPGPAPETPRQPPGGTAPPPSGGPASRAEKAEQGTGPVQFGLITFEAEK